MEMAILNPAVADITRYPVCNPEINKLTPSYIRKSAYDAYLIGKASDRLVFKTFFKINIELDDDYYIVSDDVFLVYGDGDTREAAMQDYLSSLIEFYEIVKDKSETNVFEHKVFELLQSLISVK